MSSLHKISSNKSVETFDILYKLICELKQETMWEGSLDDSSKS
jgi:hypothetical protein